MKEKAKVEIKDKIYLTIDEASALFGIGQTKLRKICKEENAKFVLYNGSKTMINRKQLENYLKDIFSIYKRCTLMKARCIIIYAWLFALIRKENKNGEKKR